MPPSRIASISSRNRNGVPRVARRQASTNVGAGALPSRDSTKCATPERVNGASRITSADESIITVASSPASVPTSRGRVATTRAMSSSSSLVSRNER